MYEYTYTHSDARAAGAKEEQDARRKGPAHVPRSQVGRHARDCRAVEILNSQLATEFAYAK